MAEVKGRRRKDTQLDEMPRDVMAGDFWRYVDRQGMPLKADRMHPEHDMSGNITNEVWGVYTPNGLYAMLTLHTVRELADGTIDVRPGDGSSNSILVESGDKSYHGYIYAGIWQEV